MVALNTADILNIVVPTLTWLYSFWLTSRKDGFDQEKAFDLAIYGLLGALVFGIAADLVINGQSSLKLQSVNFYAGIFGFISVCSIVTLKYKWSPYRVLDNLAVSFIPAAAIWFLAMFVQRQYMIGYVAAATALFIVSYALQKYRGVFLKSGMVFCLVSGIFCLVAAFLLPRSPSLIFVGLLFTLSLIVLIFRLRSIYGKSNGSK